MLLPVWWADVWVSHSLPRSYSFDKKVAGFSQCNTWNWRWIYFLVGIFDFFKGQGVSVQILMKISMKIGSFVLSVVLWAADSTTCAPKCFQVVCNPQIRFLMKNWKFNDKMPCLGTFPLLMMTLKAPTPPGPTARSSFQVSPAFFGDRN